MILGHRLFHHAQILGRLGFGELLLERWDDAIGKLAGPREIALALRLLEFDPGVVELFLDLLCRGELLLLGLPLASERRQFFLECRQFLFEPLEPILGSLVGLLLQRLALDLHLHDAAVELIKLFGLRPACAGAPPPRP